MGVDVLGLVGWFECLEVWGGGVGVCLVVLLSLRGGTQLEVGLWVRDTSEVGEF